MSEKGDQVVRISFSWIVFSVVLILLLGVLGGVLVVMLWPPMATPLSFNGALPPQIREVTISPGRAWSETVSGVDRSIVLIQSTQGNSLGTGVAVTTDGLIATTAPITSSVEGVDMEGQVFDLDFVGRDIMTGVIFLRMREGILPPLDVRSDDAPVGMQALVFSRSRPSFRPKVRLTHAQGYSLPDDAAAGVPRLLDIEQIDGSNWDGAAVIDERGLLAGLLIDHSAGIVLPTMPLRDAITRVSSNERERNQFTEFGVQGTYVFTQAEDQLRFGFQISSVIAASSAARATVRSGDILIGIDGDDISWDDLLYPKLSESPSQIEVLRGENILVFSTI